MSVIKDGCVSGHLPEAEAFAVNYPGYPSSTSRAISTLGGIDGILKARSSLSNHLELHFRPEDPYSHPAFGELHPCSGLLLRISRKKCSNEESAFVPESKQGHLSAGMQDLEQASCIPESCKDGQQNSLSGTQIETADELKDVEIHEASSSSTKLCADIVARVPQIYHFNGMVDYQHVLAVHADVARRKKRHWTEVETDFEKAGLMNLDQEDLMCLVPLLFSPKDIPENLVLNPSANLNSKRKQVAIVRNRWEMDIEPCFAIDFFIEEIPKKINWEDNIPQGSVQWEWQVAMSKLFDEQPIWPRCSLHECLNGYGLKVSEEQLKRLFLRNAYYFSSGPFKHFWIKKGYDPRKDPESRIYQRVDFRVPDKLRNPGEMNRVDESPKWKDICEFKVFPPKSFINLQFFELADDYIQEEIRKPAEKTCTRLTGWFSKNVFESLKLRVMMRFLSICPRSEARDLLNYVHERFEKSKKLHIYGRESRADEEKIENTRGRNNCPSEAPAIRSSNTGIVCRDDGGGDEDEEEAGEEEEEEYEEYGSLNEDGDGTFSLEPNSYPMAENNDYLQKLLGTLQFTKDGNYSMAPDADMSDGEYQIYEQDSGSDNDNYYNGDEDDF